MQKSDADWAAWKIRKIIKGEDIPYGFWMPISGANTYINTDKTSLCLSEIVKRCAEQLLVRIPQGCTLVPIPNSNGTYSNPDFKTLDHALDIAARIGQKVEARPMLLWREPQSKSHHGGRRRDHNEHYASLRVHGTTKRRIVLYDDVVTSGSQIIASTRKLEDAGFDVAGTLTVVSVLERDGSTHSDICNWVTEERSSY